MRLADFHYELPPELIAQYPAESRSASRLLCLNGDSGSLRDGSFPDIHSLVEAGDVLVLNDTRVVKARLRGRKETGGRVEILVERVLDDRRALALLRASKTPGSGARLCLEGDVALTVVGRTGELFELELAGERPWSALLNDFGELALPPYISRSYEPLDAQRYQTVFARRDGAVAAPTAGLHFDQQTLDRLRGAGVRVAFITLHVGLGTFQPVRVDPPSLHRMHAEQVEVSEDVCTQIDSARAAGRRVVAVGTTCVRALETAWRGGRVRPWVGETRLFIYPGYRFSCVDALLTNFHLPGSTLMMLVCAFAGTDNVLAAYRHAVRERYRFFSYGDAMFMTRRSPTSGP